MKQREMNELIISVLSHTEWRGFTEIKKGLQEKLGCESIDDLAEVISWPHVYVTLTKLRDRKLIERRGRPGRGALGSSVVRSEYRLTSGGKRSSTRSQLTGPLVPSAA